MGDRRNTSYEAESQIRTAIVGTGLAGLTTAHLLHNDERKRYAVTLLEQVSDSTQ